MTAAPGASLPELVLRRFLQGAWHAVPAGKLAPPTAMIDRDFGVSPRANRSADRCMAA